MTLHCSSHNALRLLFAGCVCLIAVPLIGCGAKEETQPAGYYTGPLQKKEAAPAAGGTSTPAAPAGHGKASSD